MWDCLLTRLSESGDRAALFTANACLGESRALEHREQGDAIRGEHYQTLWLNPERGLAGASAWRRGCSGPLGLHGGQLREVLEHLILHVRRDLGVAVGLDGEGASAVCHRAQVGPVALDLG